MEHTALKKISQSNPSSQNSEEKEAEGIGDGGYLRKQAH